MADASWINLFELSVYKCIVVYVHIYILYCCHRCVEGECIRAELSEILLLSNHTVFVKIQYGSLTYTHGGCQSVVFQVKQPEANET